MNRRNEYRGLLRRRDCLVPTWRGLLLFALLVAGLVALTMSKIHPFLAVTEPVSANILVVEGWVPDYVLKETKNEFERGHYRKLYVTGGPLENGSALSEYKTYAELGTAILNKMGISDSALEAVPFPSVRQDRTYTSALALNNLLRQQGASGTGIVLISLGAHSRRSRLLFQKALGDNSIVGIIAVEDRSYDPDHWWKFSAGVRAVVDELFAYTYAQVVFPFIEP